MADIRDLSAIHQGALKRAFETYVDSVRGLKERIGQPMQHEGQVPKEERMTETRMWQADPTLLAAMTRETATRFNLPPEKPISRRFAKTLIKRWKELEAENV